MLTSGTVVMTRASVAVTRASTAVTNVSALVPKSAPSAYQSYKCKKCDNILIEVCKNDFD